MNEEELAAAAAAKVKADADAAPAAAAEAAAKEAAEAKAKADAEAAALAAKPKPTDEEAKLLKETMKHKAAAQKAADELAQATERLKAFEGLDPVKLRELVKQQEEAATTAAEARGDYERLKAQMAERHTAEQAALTTQITAAAAANADLQRQIADITVGAAFTSSKFIADDLILPVAKARALYGSHFAYEKGQVVGYDKPAGAKDRTPLVSATGEPLSFENAMQKLVDADPDKDHLRRAKGKPGAGSNTNTNPRGKATQAAKPEITGRDRIAESLKAKPLAK